MVLHKRSQGGAQWQHHAINAAEVVLARVVLNAIIDQSMKADLGAARMPNHYGQAIGNGSVQVLYATGIHHRVRDVEGLPWANHIGTYDSTQCEGYIPWEVSQGVIERPSVGLKELPFNEQASHADIW